MKIVMVRVLIILTACGVVGCESASPPTASSATAPAPAAASAKLAAYTEKIPGTLVSFDMIPMGGGTTMQSFWIGKTEVTWDEFDIWAFSLDIPEKDRAAGVDAESRPSKPYGAPDRGYGHQGYPAMSMTHEAAETYCMWLSAKTGKKYRLPTEAEWRLACRAGADFDKSRADVVAWFADNSQEKTHPVASKQANAFGLFDTAGNVAEWCVAADGKYVACGGSFVSSIDDIGCAARRPDNPRWKDTDPQDPKSKWWLSDGPFIGFRVVREP
jgi:formylglycine-generating enzyme required for sulfatase activity